MSYDGVSGAELAGRLSAVKCLSLVKATSTLDILHQLAEEGALAGTVVLADEQTAGRGRLGRTWYSPAGKGIWMGYLVRPASGIPAGVLALRVGLAVADTLADMGVAVALKWPNDIVLEERKLGGVLCEAKWAGSRVRWIAVGIGLNVTGGVTRELEDEAVALSEVCPGATRLGVLERLVPELNALRDSPVLTQEELRSYSRRDWLRGRRIVEPVRGEVAGIDEGGALLVGEAGRTRRVMGGSVVTE